MSSATEADIQLADLPPASPASTSPPSAPARRSDDLSDSTAAESIQPGGTSTTSIQMQDGTHPAIPPWRHYALLLSRRLKRLMLSKSFAVCLAICALIITFITIFPTYFGTEYGKQSLELAKWTAAKDFKEFCRDEFV
jgi:hypothetical protein